eukprot:2941539-Rhodomonas_salina.1
MGGGLRALLSASLTPPHTPTQRMPHALVKNAPPALPSLSLPFFPLSSSPVSYTHLRAHETEADL